MSEMALTNLALTQRIKARAYAAGFDLVGIASAEPSRHREFVRRWLDAGRAGSMDYLHRRFDERTDPATYFPGCRSVICVALNYNPALTEPPTQPAGMIARYALGDDYHDLMKDRLHSVADFIREMYPGSATRVAVDTAPVLERELAARAGIGWVGKNTCIIHPKVGSYILLGEIFTNLELAPDDAVSDHCGSCTRCLDACPTQAFVAPYELDASRCISYLTIEHRGDIAEELQSHIGDKLYGCDICQEVCPHNRSAPVAIDNALKPRFASGALNAAEILTWSQETYRSTLRRSAMKRTKLPILQRNARIVEKNCSLLEER